MKGFLLRIIHRNVKCHILLSKFQIISIISIYISSQRYIIAEGCLKIQQVAVKVKKTIANSLQAMIFSLKVVRGVNYRQP